MPRVAVAWVVLCLALAVGACGASPSDRDPGPKVVAPSGVRPARALGTPEGTLDLVAPGGYVPADATGGLGCTVHVTPAQTSDDVVRKLSTGRFDGALGTADATVRLITAGVIAPVNTRLIPNYPDVYDGLKQRPFNSVGGQLFALPAGRSTDLMLWRRNTIPGTITSLGALLDPAQVASYGEQVAVPDDPRAIAETAVWVAHQRADLKIDDPYELDRRQFDAVLDILRHQHPFVSDYWRDPAAVRAAFRAGRASIGLATQQVVGELQAHPGPGGPVAATRPREGATGASPAWMVAAGAKHPNCMYRWLNRSLDPRVNAEVAEAAAIAPANRKACDTMADDRFCSLYHADDDDYYAKVLYRTLPSADCGDARGRVCMDWEDWVRAFRRVISGS
jgi:putative spermidine/putrescine transport system substrate-binding protein